MDEIKLNPCKICGGEAELCTERDGIVAFSYVRCKKCGQQTSKFLSTPEKSGETAALERWELCHLMQLRSKSLGKWEISGLIDRLGKRVKIPIAKCPHCGFSVCDILNCPDLYDYCPHCGKKVNMETEEA
nr:MAG TPA: restriction alleviation protein [Caudoviricetes sp.]